MGSRLLPLVLATAALAAGTVGLGGLALWLGLLAVPAAAAVAFVAVSDALEGRPALLHAVTSGVALGLVVLSSAFLGRREAIAGYFGLEPDAVRAFASESPFALEQRLIEYRPVGALSKATLPELEPAIA